MAWRGLKPGWLILAGVAAAVGLWFGLPALGRRMEFFRVRRIEVVGIRYLSADNVVAAMHLNRNASVFDRLAPIEARVRGIRGVAEARVERRLPGALRVRIREVPPVALVPRARGMAMMDSAGRVLPFDPARSAPDLPVVQQADGSIGRLLGRVQAVEPPMFAEIASAWRDHDDVVLEADGRRYWFAPDASAEEIRAVMAVAQELKRQGRSFGELDGRFAGRVVVRGMRRESGS